MQVLLLGPTTVVDRTQEHVLRSGRQAGLLAVLALHRNQTVPLDVIVDALWGHEPPSTVRNTLQVHVSGLRRLLGRDAIRSSGVGYTLDMPGLSCDVDAFGEQVTAAETSIRRGRWPEASRLFRSALALWRGRALAGLDGPWFEMHRDALERRRVEAQRGGYEADLRVGGHLGVLPELTRVCAEHPYDEELARLLMLAQYRGGRADEALATYRQTRRRLVDDLGVEPGPRLRQLHREILDRDPGLEPDPRLSVVPLSALPSPTALVGRGADLAALEARLGARPAGPTTLVGPSGVGKSRLAGELARRLQGRFRDGAAVLDLETASGTDGLASRIAEALGIRLVSDPVAELAESDALVVLDGIRVDDPGHAGLVDQVADLGPVVLATAHRPCGWRGEHVHPVRPLASEVDRDQDAGSPSPAAELLLLRAEAAGADVGGVLEDAEACARLLDGMPLAIELAAPRAVLGFDELRAGLERERGRGRAGVAVSYAASLRRRSDGEQDLLEVLARCTGPVDAEWVGDLPGRDAGSTAKALAALLRDGLVRQREGSHGRPTYEVLSGVRHEVVGDGETSATWQADIVRTHAAWLSRSGIRPSFLESAEFSRRNRALLDAAEGALAGGLELKMHSACLAIARTLIEHTLVVRPEVVDRAWRVLTTDEALAMLTPVEQVMALESGAAWADLHGQADRMTDLAEEAVARARELGDPAILAGAIGSSVVTSHINGRACAADPEEALRLLADADALTAAGVRLWIGLTRPDGVLLAQSIEQARSLRHAGVLALGLANAAESRLGLGDASGAAQLASEASGMYASMHVGLMHDYTTSTLTTCSALLGSGSDLARVADVVEWSWRREDLRGLTDALLKLAAALRATGDTEAARHALGLFWTQITTHGVAVAETERQLLDAWLDGVSPVSPDRPVPDVLTRVLAAARRRDAGDTAVERSRHLAG
ncbi:AfsR/SARP family transcriptional regulator [Nocardioides coralli]|uniref:AfsR/SARP family transcriptional regulator n=1 Tax=Nocardioides coralli TaxID=2872154 RepID=UPI001CA408FB|nr:BTAD domain-containing putative transcriptional regulator [Nocardioides coralli]QZY29040.1 winged helix-turn-helix domain-containing protein [Nocardioides coralli]